jgi:hypothetical protein
VGINVFSQTISVAVPATGDSAPVPGVSGSRIKPLGFWLYVLVGALMIIGSAIALPFVPVRAR